MTVTVGTSRGDQTRTRILETALRLFREQGYERTTMRAVAAEAGVAVGNAYYYFRSKEDLIQAFYARNHEEHVAACAPVLATERTLRGRLLGVMRARLDVMAPYHEFAGAFFRTAADPASPLSPFSAASQPVRAASTALFAEVVDGSDAKVPKELRPDLPELLWLYQMGVVLYWVYDRSPGAERTYLLVERTVPLVEKLIGLARLRLVRPLLRDAIELYHDIQARPPEARAT